MNRRELVQAIAAHTDQEPRAVDATLKGFVDVVLATTAKGDPVNITGFAKFAVVKRAARMGRNPATGESIKIKASKKARITPLKGFKDVALGSTPAPKLAKATPAKTAAPRKAAGTTAATKAAATKTAATKTAATKTAATKAPAKKAATKTTARKTAAKKA